MIFGQHGLRVEAIDLRHAPIQKQKDHLLRLRREVGRFGTESGDRSIGMSLSPVVAEQGRQSDHSEPAAHSAQSLSPGHMWHNALKDYVFCHDLLGPSLHKKKIVRAQQHLCILLPRRNASSLSLNLRLCLLGDSFDINVLTIL